MPFAYWSLLVGILLIAMVLVSTILTRLPLSSAMIYLALGYALGPGGIGVILADPLQQAGMLELITETALLISLFAVGLRLGVPLLDRRWALPLRLAFPSMAITVGLIALIGVWGLGMSPGAAVLLGGILAPTDPVLAAGIQSGSDQAADRMRFGLAGEGALNDGAAYPFVLLGLGLMEQHDLGAYAWHWWMIDLLWATLGGLMIGALLGTAIGQLIVYLRTRHHNAVGLNEFVSLGLIAMSYGFAQLCLASGFLAVFAAGLALRRIEEHPLAGSVALGQEASRDRQPAEDRATHSHHASAAMMHGVREFNEQLEKLAELTIVLLIGAMLPYAKMSTATWWFVPLLFLAIRPIAVLVGSVGAPLRIDQYAMIGWFGIRGIGSVFYLVFALDRGLDGTLADTLISLTLITVAASILVHGVSVLSLTRWYERRHGRRR
ncbi:MAG TPA: sodium:proton antiporter [Rhodocyclaceae bacterium]|nr:sodium:proton antiporter [Rhodocyclaceae bacterium]